MTAKRIKTTGRKKREIAVPVVIEKSRTGYSAYSPSVPGCITTGKTIDGTLESMREALELHIETEFLLSHRQINVNHVLKFVYDKSHGDEFYGVINIAV